MLNRYAKAVRPDAVHLNMVGMIAMCAVFVLVTTVAHAQDFRQVRVLVSTQDRAVLSSELSARIERIAAMPGEMFSKGDLLVSFDCAAYKAQRATVAADYRQAAAQLKSQQRLFELRSVGELDVTMAEAAGDRAKAQLQLQDVYLERCAIKAPYDGTVVSWFSQPYETANAGDDLIEVIGTGNLQLELVVSSGWLTWLSVGNAFHARVEETGQELIAEIDRITTDIDPVSQTVKVFAVIKDGGDQLVPGMSGVAFLDPVGPSS